MTMLLRVGKPSVSLLGHEDPRDPVGRYILFSPTLIEKKYFFFARKMSVLGE